MELSKEVPVSVIDRTRAAIERTCDYAHGAHDRAHSTYARVSHVALAPSLSLLRWGILSGYVRSSVSMRDRAHLVQSSTLTLT